MPRPSYLCCHEGCRDRVRAQNVRCADPRNGGNACNAGSSGFYFSENNVPQISIRKVPLTVLSSELISKSFDRIQYSPEHSQGPEEGLPCHRHVFFCTESSSPVANPQGSVSQHWVRKSVCHVLFLTSVKWWPADCSSWKKGRVLCFRVRCTLQEGHLSLALMGLIREIARQVFPMPAWWVHLIPGGVSSELVVEQHSAGRRSRLSVDHREGCLLR